MAVTKADLTAYVADSVGLTKKDAGAAVDSIFERIAKALAGGDKVTLIGFGTFEVVHRKARQGVNPQTMAKIQIPAHNAPVFRPGKGLKEAVRK